jgi:hypothetical protein
MPPSCRFIRYNNNLSFPDPAKIEAAEPWRYATSVGCHSQLAIAYCFAWLIGIASCDSRETMDISRGLLERLCMPSDHILKDTFNK